MPTISVPPDLSYVSGRDYSIVRLITARRKTYHMKFKRIRIAQDIGRFNEVGDLAVVPIQDDTLIVSRIVIEEGRVLDAYAVFWRNRMLSVLSERWFKSC